jgi:hypothetical protein
LLNGIYHPHPFLQKGKSRPPRGQSLFSLPSLFQTFISLLDPLKDVLGLLTFQFEYLNMQQMKSQGHFQEIFEEFAK